MVLVVGWNGGVNYGRIRAESMTGIQDRAMQRLTGGIAIKTLSRKESGDGGRGDRHFLGL